MVDCVTCSAPKGQRQDSPGQSDTAQPCRGALGKPHQGDPQALKGRHRAALSVLAVRPCSLFPVSHGDTETRREAHHLPSMRGAMQSFIDQRSELALLHLRVSVALSGNLLRSGKVSQRCLSGRSTRNNPGRRHALPWADLSCPFGADGPWNDSPESITTACNELDFPWRKGKQPPVVGGMAQLRKFSLAAFVCFGTFSLGHGFSRVLGAIRPVSRISRPRFSLT